MKVSVYHMTHAAFREGLDSLGRMEAGKSQSLKLIGAAAASKYRHCADVICNDLEEAYSFTTNIDDSWTEIDAVVLPFCAGPNQRSSMVGDIFVVEDKAFIIAGCGFTEIYAPGFIVRRLEAHCPKGTSHDGWL